MKAGQDNPELNSVPDQVDLEIETLGAPQHESPLTKRKKLFVGSDNGVLITAETLAASQLKEEGKEIPHFEMAGPRENLYFDPEKQAALS